MRTGDVGEITAPRLSFPTWVVFADLGDGSSLRRVCTMPATDSLSLAQDVANFSCHGKTRDKPCTAWRRSLPRL